MVLGQGDGLYVDACGRAASYESVLNQNRRGIIWSPILWIRRKLVQGYFVAMLDDELRVAGIDEDLRSWSNLMIHRNKFKRPYSSLRRSINSGLNLSPVMYSVRA